MADGYDRLHAALDAREGIEAEIARIEARLGRRESEAAGELPDADQHPAELGSETYDRERDEQRLEELRERVRQLDDAIEHPGATPPPAGERLTAEVDEEEDDDSTPLDAVEPDPEDLGAIPMGSEEALDKDAQDLDAPGAVYREGAGAPEVGDPDDIELEAERRYRPQR